MDLAVGLGNAQRFPGWSEYLGTPSGDFLKSTGRTQSVIGTGDRPFHFLPPDRAKEILDDLRTLAFYEE